MSGRQHDRGRPRRPWLVCAVAATAAITGLVAISCGGPGKPPNVVIIVLDTVRADYLSSYGYHQPTTPATDALAASGARFTRAFSTDFWTLPAHASLFTGLMPSQIGATSESRQLVGEVETLAERLRDAGYETRGIAGNSWISKERGFAQGFNRFVEAWRNSDASSRVDIEEAATDRLTGWVSELATGDKPFFLFANFNIAHLPYDPTEDVRAEFVSTLPPPERLDLLRRVRGLWMYLGGVYQLSEDDFRTMRELYAAELNLDDRLVGRIAAALEAAGVLDDTLVIVTSDHGENIGDHGLIDHLLSMHDTTIRVPLVMRYPKRFDPGTVRDDLMSLIDVYPTVLEICGAATGAEDGALAARSLASPEWTGRQFVAAENERPVNGIDFMRKRFPEYDVGPIDLPMRMYRTATHKLVWKIGGAVELYDLVEDPGELTNIADTEPERVRELRAAHDTWSAALERVVVAPGQLASEDEESLEQLRALGYIH